MHVGQRVSLNGHRGTIRYLGPLAGSSSAWIGIEWDDLSRGKHSGTLKDRQIFACKLGTGSFLKQAKVTFDKSYSIADAIRNKYIEESRGVSEEISNAVGISRPIQSVGFDKIRERYRNLSQITELFLANENIDRLNLDSEQDFSKVKTLDLSWNLLTSFKEVLELSQKLPLQTLKLEGNRFQSTSTSTSTPPQSFPVEDLSLSLTCLGWSDIQHIVKQHFTSLTVLHLAMNDLQDCSDNFELDSVTNLDLLGNKLTDLHQLISHFPALQLLNISNNNIKFIKPFPGVQFRAGAQIKHINLAGNPLETLQDVSNLACYPELRSLQFTLLLDDKQDESSRLQLIKYLPQLEVINRTKVTLQERQDAERFGQAPVTLTHSMVNNFVTLTLVSETSTLEKKVLKTQTVKQLKATFARFVKSKPTQIHSLIYKFEDQTIELHNDLAQLSYYDLCTGGSIFHSR